MRRLISRFRRHGSEGLISRRIGMRPSNAVPEPVRQNIMTIISRNYSDFGPTLACEYLRDRHDVSISAETLRKWMTDEGLRKLRQRRRAGIRPLRERRARREELVQIDGSHHDWFEGRRDISVLTAFVDDAAGELAALRSKRRKPPRPAWRLCGSTWTGTVA